MQTEGIVVYLNRIEFDHEIFRITVRIDFFECFNAKAGKVDTNPGFGFEKFNPLIIFRLLGFQEMSIYILACNTI